MSNKQLYGLLGGILAGIAVKKASSGSKATDPQGRVFPRDFDADISKKGGIPKDLTINQWDESYSNFYKNINWDDYLANSYFLAMHFHHILREEMFSNNYTSFTDREVIDNYYIPLMKVLNSQRIQMGFLLSMKYNDDRFLEDMTFSSYLRILREIHFLAYNTNKYDKFAEEYDYLLDLYNKKRANPLNTGSEELDNRLFNQYWSREFSKLRVRDSWNDASGFYCEFLRNLSGGINPSISFLEILRYGSYIERSCDVDFYGGFFDSIYKMSSLEKQYLRSNGEERFFVNSFYSIQEYGRSRSKAGPLDFLNLSVEYLKLCYFIGDLLNAFASPDSVASKEDLIDLVRVRALSVFASSAEDLANIFMIRSVISTHSKVVSGAFSNSEIAKSDAKILKAGRRGADRNTLSGMGGQFLTKVIVKNLSSENVDVNFSKKVKRFIIEPGVGGKYFRDISIDQFNQFASDETSSIVFNKTSFFKSDVKVTPAVKTGPTVSSVFNFLNEASDPTK
jgi:hypothetical protein